MTEKQARNAFTKYNPADKISRCPNGYAGIRKLLDKYARAAMNLYGIISKKELAGIFNSQNSDLIDISGDEVFTLLLPLVAKSKDPWYCFYKDYIVHYFAFEDFSYADGWLAEQGDKPRFIPEKVEFLKFEYQFHVSQPQAAFWEKVRLFIIGEWEDNRNKYMFYRDLKEIAPFALGFSYLSKLLEKYDLPFESQKSAEKFFALYSEAYNNTRMWSNKGHTPNELGRIYAGRSSGKSDEVVIRQAQKISPNQFCPCGSGKKYRKCCSVG